MVYLPSSLCFYWNKARHNACQTSDQANLERNILDDVHVLLYTCLALKIKVQVLKNG